MTDEERKAKKREYFRERYRLKKQDPTFLEKRRAYNKEYDKKKRLDPAVRERIREYDKKKRLDPAFKSRERERMRLKRQDPEFISKKRGYDAVQREKYRARAVVDPEFAIARKTYHVEYNKQRLLTDAAYKERQKELARARRPTYNEKKRQRYATDEDFADRLREQASLYRKRRSTDNAYVERRRKFVKKYKEQNPEKVAVIHNARLRRKKGVTPHWANKELIREAYALARLRMVVCGGKWHVDHIVPLTSDIVQGFHVETNLRVIPGTVNNKKYNKLDEAALTECPWLCCFDSSSG